MKKTAAFLLLFLTGALFCVPADAAVTGTEDRPKVGLVLSGGGAKGVAHIGALKVLEEAGIPIDYVAGTSMGAIMGGLYSIGYTPHELDSMVRTQNWVALLSDRVERGDKLFHEKESGDTYIISVPISLDTKFTMPSGAVAGQNVRNLLNEMTIGYHDSDIDFSKLPIPFACVAYDMVKGEEYVFHHGNLPTAIRSSMSIPGVFAPVLVDSMVLVDGGIYNNFPVDVVRRMGADVVIGIDVSAGTPEYQTINTIMGIIDQITTFMGRDKYTENMKGLDVYVKPPVKPYTSASFSPEAVDSLLVRGERETRKHWDEIVALRDRVCGVEYTHECPPRPRVLDQDSVYVGSINFNGLSLNEEPLIRRSLGLRENSAVTKLDVNNAIARLRGSGAFSYVTYTLESSPPYNMLISVNEKQEASINLGFRFDSEQMASILLGTSFSFRGLMGPKLDAAVRLNDNPYVKLDFNSSSWFLGRFGVSYMYKYNKYTFYQHRKPATDGSTNPVNKDAATSVIADVNKIDLFINNSNPRKFYVNFGMQVKHFNYRTFLMTSGTSWDIIEPQLFINYYATGNFENYDNYYYPTKGYSLNTLVGVHTDNAYTFEDNLPFMSVQYNFETAISANSRLTFIPSVYGRTVIGHNSHFAYDNVVGGEMEGRYVTHQMPFPGIRDVEMLENSVMIASLEIRQRIFRRNYISAKGAFATQNDDFFRMFSSDISDRYLWGVAVKYSYDSPIGPLSVQIDKSNISRFGVYFSLGKYF